MRKLFIPIVLATLALSTLACAGLTFEFNRGVRVTGSGDVVTENRDVSGFDVIEFNTVGELLISQGEQESLSIEAEENILEHIRTEVRGGTLVIDVDDAVSLDLNAPITYTVVVTDLREFKLNGLGNVKLDGLQADELELDMHGAGNLEARGLTADRLEVELSGLGSVTPVGAVDELVVSIPGSGNFSGADLQSRTARVRVSGLGNATVWVTGRLDVEISGAGNVSYYGSPDVTQDVSGLGRVERRGDK